VPLILLLAINRVCWTGVDASSPCPIPEHREGSVLTKETVSGDADGMHYNTSIESEPLRISSTAFARRYMARIFTMVGERRMYLKAEFQIPAH
jgi:hypothetical protein